MLQIAAGWAPRKLPEARCVAYEHRTRAALPLLGELQPLVRQLFVPPFAFLLPAIRNDCGAVRRVAGEFFGLGLAPAPDPESRPPFNHPTLARTSSSRCDCRHKNAFLVCRTAAVPGVGKSVGVPKPYVLRTSDGRRAIRCFEDIGSRCGCMRGVAKSPTLLLGFVLQDGSVLQAIVAGQALH